MKIPSLMVGALLAVWLPVVPSAADPNPTDSARQNASPQDSSLQDPAWTRGRLDNGIRYFIRRNEKPEGRLELRLVVDAGSILEAEDQRGLAHYLEHMAFNGTRNFEKHELVAFLESLGMAFGPDLNAYTSFDETVYKLRLPTEDPEVVEQAFLILSDWADGITNADEALEAERGVIIEEWRGRRGAEARVRDAQYPLILKDSRYAERLPIGTLEVLRTFDFDRLRDFYADWYRPELMTVVAVGDLDVEDTRKRIQRVFGEIAPEPDAPARPIYEHPPVPERRAGVFTDPELTRAGVGAFWNHPPRPVTTPTQWVAAEKDALVADMLNQRLEEVSSRADAPFLGAGAYAGSFTRAGSVFYLSASVKDEAGAALEAGRALFRELERARRHGFIPGEVERAVARRLRRAEAAVAEARTTDSAKLVAEMVQHALTDAYVGGPERELALLREQLPSLTPEKARSILREWLDTPNQVILAEGPAHPDGHHLPSEEELLALAESVKTTDLEPYADAMAGAELVRRTPSPGEVVEREEREDLGLTLWTLSNGARVMIKPTDFKRDEVLVSAWSPGGMNLADDAEWPSARLADSVAAETGMGEFSVIELGKLLSGKRVSLSPFLEMDREGLSAAASPRDLETLFQLIHLRFTTVRRDDEAFEALRDRLRESVRNRDSSPRQVYEDVFAATLSTYHPRLSPLTLEDVEAMDQEEALSFFRERFADAGDFTFLIVGNVDPDALEPLVETWLGALPGLGREEEPAFLETDFPRFEVERRVKRGVDPVGEVRMVWISDEFEWSFASRHAVQSLAAALRIRLREELREDKGGTYHVSVVPRLSHYPEPLQEFIIRFGCDPERVEELIAEVNRVVEDMGDTLLEDRYLEIVRQTQLRKRETDLRENSFWDYVLSFYDWHGEDPAILLEFDSHVADLTAESIRETAREVFDTPHRSVFVLLPEPEEDHAVQRSAVGQPAKVVRRSPVVKPAEPAHDPLD